MQDTRETLRSHISKRVLDDELSNKYATTKRRKMSLIIILLVSIVVTSVTSISLGAADISIADVLKTFANVLIPGLFDVPEGYGRIILDTRMPRILLAIITGASLAAAGCIMQGILRNPLVSPFTLGVSTAAAFGAGIAILIGPTMFGAMYSLQFSLFGHSMSGSSLITILFAFLFGLVSISFVLFLTRRENISKSTIVLSGVVISYLFQAGLSFIKYVSDDSALRDITLWTMGNLWNASWAVIILIVPFILICMIYLEKISIDINTLSSGMDVAKNLGIDVAKLRTNSLLVCTIMTCICLAFTGAIGFIGLMAPHICRRVIGNDHRYLLPASALMGSLILLISDTVSRTCFSTDIPVGILIYIIGGAFFVWMVVKKDWRDST